MSLFKGYEGQKLVHLKIYCDNCQALILFLEDSIDKDNYFQKKNGNDFCDYCSREFKYRKKKEEGK